MYINKAKKIVIKLGSSTIVDAKGNFKKKWFLSLIKDIKKLKKNKKEIVVVSSGAIALGQNYLKIKKKRLKIEMSQAIASVGQIHLTNEFQKLNENDTTATTEIKYGDNDRLAARVAQIIGADLLIILSDIDGLYEKSQNKKSLIQEVKKIDNKILSLVEKKINTYGSGGMLTKLEAAKICMNSGCYMSIANGKHFNPIERILKKKICTWFIPKISNLAARKKWIISSLSTSAKIFIDQGASRALRSGKSLLPSGITKVSGSFKKGDNILIMDNNNLDVARALSSFSSDEIDKIKGLQSDQIEKILGYASKSEIVHKDDIVIL